MVGSSSPGVHTFSAITAALFADSGWYEVNEALVEPLSWGHHAGCAFVHQSCAQWSQPRYTCNSAGEQACSFDRQT